MKTAFAFLTATLMSTAVLAAPAPGTKSALAPSDSNAPINISSDSFQADLNGKTGTWAGNVLVIQGDMKLRSNQVHMSTVNGKADKVTAAGNVVVDSPKSGIVTGDNGVYSVAPRTVLMTGNVTLKKGKDVMRGCQLTVNLNSGQAVLGSCGKAAGAAGTNTPGTSGRVQGVFIPNSN
jgi:lipopolysaccharide export system protein LptA